MSRLRRLNWIAACAFTIGGSLFATGAWVAQVGSGDATTAASIYFTGGVFFCAGAYASLLGVGNVTRWRWFPWEPGRIGWLSALVLLAGTVAFGVSLVDAFIEGLSTHGTNRLIWRPEIVGCVLFLLSGHLAMREVCGRALPCVRRRDLSWSITAINQVGSVLFMIAAIAAFTRPASGQEVNVAVANWGTFAGALCFAAGGVMQAFDGPEAGLSG